MRFKRFSEKSFRLEGEARRGACLLGVIFLVGCTLAGRAAAQEFTPLEEIGWKRGSTGGLELRLRLEPRVLKSPSASGEVRLGPLSPTEEWLVADLRRRFPALHRCEVEASARATCSAHSVDIESERNLVLSGAREVLLEARTHLSRLRSAWRSQLHWEMRLIVLDEPLRDPFTADVRVRVLSPEEKEALLDGPGETVTAPSIVTLAGRRASLSIMENTSYVRDFSLKLTDAGIVAEPVAGNLEEGLRLELVGIPLAGGETLVVKGTYRSSAATRPVRKWRVEIPGRERDLTLELPETTTMKLGLSAAVPLGATFVFEGLPWLRREAEDAGTPVPRRALLVCRVTRVEDGTEVGSGTVSGTVLGVDPERRLVFFEVAGADSLRIGRRVSFERPDAAGRSFEASGRGRILEIHGRGKAIVVADITEGRPRAGDRVR